MLCGLLYCTPSARWVVRKKQRLPIRTPPPIYRLVSIGKKKRKENKVRGDFSPLTVVCLSFPCRAGGAALPHFGPNPAKLLQICTGKGCGKARVADACLSFPFLAWPDGQHGPNPAKLLGICIGKGERQQWKGKGKEQRSFLSLSGLMGNAVRFARAPRPCRANAAPGTLATPRADRTPIVIGCRPGIARANVGVTNRKVIFVEQWTNKRDAVHGSWQRWLGPFASRDDAVRAVMIAWDRMPSLADWPVRYIEQ